MAQSNLAYDLERFEEYQPKIEKSPAKKRTASPTHPVRILFLAILSLAVVSTVLYSRVMIAELNQQINEVTEELDVLQSESVRMQSELESRMSLSAVEEAAMSEYGMVKPDNSQVTYVNLNRENKIEQDDENVGLISQIIAFCKALISKEA